MHSERASVKVELQAGEDLLSQLADLGVQYEEVPVRAYGGRISVVLIGRKDVAKVRQRVAESASPRYIVESVPEDQLIKLRWHAPEGLSI